MSDITILLLEASISIFASIITMLLISKPLKESLLELCPTVELANFWLAYTRTMMLIAPLLLVLLINSTHDGHVFSDFRSALIATFSGLLLGLIVIGKKMYIPVGYNKSFSEKG